MITGQVSGLFATTVGGVPKPRVDLIDIETLGIKNEIIRDKKHHGGAEKAVCIISEEVIHDLRDQGHPISGGTTGENILLSVPYDALNPGVLLEFEQVTLEITMAASPCKTIADSFINQEFNLLSDKKYPGKTRWYARVLNEGTVYDGETVTISSIS